MTKHGEDQSPAAGLDDLADRSRSAVSTPVPAEHPLDVTYSPSREGSTPMPGPLHALSDPPNQSLVVARGTGPYGMNAIAPIDPLHNSMNAQAAQASRDGSRSGSGPAFLPPMPSPVAPVDLAFANAQTVAPPPTPQPGIASSRSGQSSGNTPALGSVPALFVGHVLGGRWEVQQRIGIGGMASVHGGIDHRLGRPVAVKILHPHVAENPDSRMRLGREARAIAQLKHENIIEVYDYSSDDPDCTWLVTELVDGGSLRQILDRIEKPMPETAVMITTEVVRALRAAHTMGIVHRDVKPDNILVGSSGRPKLSDFGIAQILNEERMTLTGNLVGSPSYMSPEQANGKRTDHRTDLFSAGILLYRLVTGTLPFRGATAIETIRKVSLGEYTDPVEIESGCAGAVAGIIRRALATNIDDRYQSADEMLHDLATVLQDAGLSATWEELPKFFKDPSGYQSQLRPRLARELEARGKALLEAGEETRAVDCFNRALSLGEGNQRTLDLVRELSKRRGKGRVRKFVWATGLAIGAVAAITGVLLVTDRLLSSNAAEVAKEERQIVLPIDAVKSKVAEPAEPDAEQHAAKVENAGPAPQPANDMVVVVEGAHKDEAIQHTEHTERRAKVERKAVRRKNEASGAAAATETTGPRPTIIAAGIPHEEPARAGTPAPSAAKEEEEGSASVSYGTLHVGTKIWADIYVDDKKLGRAPERSRYPLSPGEHRLRAVKPNCLPDEKPFKIAAGETTRLRLEIICP